MAAICAATCEADPGRDKYPKSVAANDKTTIIYFYSFASKLFPGLCLSLPLYPSVRLSVCLSVTRSRAHARSLFFLLATTAGRNNCARSSSSSSVLVIRDASALRTGPLGHSIAHTHLSILLAGDVQARVRIEFE